MTDVFEFATSPGGLSATELAIEFPSRPPGESVSQLIRVSFFPLAAATNCHLSDSDVLAPANRYRVETLTAGVCYRVVRGGGFPRLWC